MSESHPATPNRFVRNAVELTRGTQCGLAIVGMCFIPSSEAQQPLPGYDEQGCMVPSAEAYAAAQRMLDAPEEEMVTRFNNSLGGNVPDNATGKTIGLKTFQAWVGQKAAALGLTVHSLAPNDYTAEWEEPAKAWEFTTSFLGQYGIKLSLGEGWGELAGIDGDRLTDEQRRSPDFADSLMLLDLQVSKYPVEFLRDKVQQSKIVFMNGRIADVGDTIDRKVAGEVAESLHSGTIFLDYKYGGAVYDHELGHFVDKRMGCLNKPDPTLTKLNPPDTYGPPELSHTPSLESLQTESLTQQQANDLIRKVVTVSKYGVTNREEDVAEINKDIERGIFSRYSHGLGSPLEGKFRLQLARFYTFDPATTQLIAATRYDDGPGDIEGVR